jgi:UDP-N-acetylmuramate--alanine ligase
MFEPGAKIFFVGIGGIGVSALGRILKAKGCEVSGSDITPSEITEKLVSEGIPVAIGHNQSNLAEGVQLLVYSQAIPEDNPERSRARKTKIPELSYAKALGELAKDKNVIAVAGTNGKTTTTAMIAAILEAAELDPTVVVGSEILAWHSNARFGQGKYFVLEADEYKRAFLQYHPDIAVVTNVQSDHLDYYKDLADVKDAFRQFVEQIKPGGSLVYNSADENSQDIAAYAPVKKIGFAIDKPAHVNEKNFLLPSLLVPGKFNRENALAAAAVGQLLNIPNSIIISALTNFGGTWRRFEKIGKVGETDVISDYAHHPAGIRVTLEAAANIYGAEKVLLVFQPHQHSRTKKLFGEFVETLCQSSVNDMIIAEIFDVAGREESEDQDVSSVDLVRELNSCGKRAQFAADLETAEKLARRELKRFKAVIFMGAGDIYKVADNLVA